MPPVVNNVGRELEELIHFLGEAGYRGIQRFPLRAYAASRRLLINELANVGRYCRRSNNLFCISLNPSIYLRVSANTRLVGLREAFFLNKRLLKGDWLRLVPEEWWHAALTKGLLEDGHDGYHRFLYRIVPYHCYMLLTSRYDRDAEDFTYLSYDSLFFADFLIRRLKALAFVGQRALDICSGVGVLSFAASNYAGQVHGMEINPSAVHLAVMNAEMNHISNCHFSNASFFGRIEGLFDLIVSNPPFIHYSESSGGPLDSDGGEPFGLGATIRIIQQLPDYLEEEGLAFVLTRSPVIKGRDYLLDQLPSLLPDSFGWAYHHVSDALVPLEASEIASGIMRYNHVIVEVARGNGGKREKLTYPFWYRRTSLF